jgi:hypothetical protein
MRFYPDGNFFSIRERRGRGLAPLNVYGFADEA